MKLLITGDWHITNKKPENRIDDYYLSLKRKINFIFETAHDRNVYCILQPGDLTDNPFLSWATFIEIRSIFDQFQHIPVITCFGQHDMLHRNKGNTALDGIIASCPNIMNNNQYDIEDNVSIYTSSYNENIPEIEDMKRFNILLLHRMIIEDKLWEQQTDFSYSTHFLRTYGFDLVVSGDNHQGFITESKILKKTLINCGSLMRSRIDQIDHKPFIVIFDTDTCGYEKIDIPIEPSEKVFNLSKVEKESENNENLKLYIQGLSESKEIGLQFESNLDGYLREIEASESIVAIIQWSKVGDKDES